MEVAGEKSPCLAGVRLRRTLTARNAETGERNPLAVQHPIQVVIGSQEKLGSVAEGLIVREPGRVRMAVRADDGEILNRSVQAARYCPDGRVGRKQPVSMKNQFLWHM